jgi:PIN like domain
VPEALRAAGLDIRVHDELFPQATQDIVWLTEAGAQRWVVITRDDRIRYNQLEKQAVLAAKLRFLQHHVLLVDWGRSCVFDLVCGSCDDAPVPTARSRRLHCQDLPRT